jgi:arsenate reductase (glutaredoxin)
VVYFWEMKKLYYLSTCDTCREIIKRLGGLKDFIWQDIKTEPITALQLEEMKEKAGSYEALFSRRAIKYREMNLKDRVLRESDYRRLILQEYTFLKRPVILAGKEIFIGNEEKNVAAAEKALKKN